MNGSGPNVPLRSPWLGCIADDVTGASDLASNLVLGGMRTVQILGIPDFSDTDTIRALDADAVVIALKSRSIPAEEAVRQSLASCEQLQSIGVQRFFFKYCSTFDSTPTGNIGPVAEAMLDHLRLEQTLFCPAFPRNGRTVYQGHLFVHAKLLNESGMENHPLNPMRDANLIRVLEAQASRRVGLLPFAAIQERQVADRLQALQRQEVPLVVCDTCQDCDLEQIARSVTDLPLLTGGSGIARFLPQAWREAGLLEPQVRAPLLPTQAGRAAILAGSCSSATNRQVKWMQPYSTSIRVDIDRAVTEPAAELKRLKQSAISADASKPIMIYSTSTPEDVATLQQRLGSERVAEAIEEMLATLGEFLVSELRIEKLILAGGETSGAITQRLGIQMIRIGPEISPGVPWTESVGPGYHLALALKSGNFGEDDFFATALEMLT